MRPALPLSFQALTHLAMMMMTSDDDDLYLIKLRSFHAFVEIDHDLNSAKCSVCFSDDNDMMRMTNRMNISP